MQMCLLCLNRSICKSVKDRIEVIVVGLADPAGYNHLGIDSLMGILVLGRPVNTISENKYQEKKRNKLYPLTSLQLSKII